jgi:hypothetical protein
MGWNKSQLNNLAKVVRGNTAVLNAEKITKMLTGISFEEARRLMVSDQEYGNTKFSDDWIVYCYFKAGFIASQASVLAGYYMNNVGSGYHKGGTALKERMARMNTSDMFSLARCFINARQISKNDLKSILETTTKNQRIAAASPLYQFWAKELVLAAIKKQGSRSKAAKAFGTTEEVVNKWADIEVERPL